MLAEEIFTQMKASIMMVAIWMSPARLVEMILPKSRAFGLTEVARTSMAREVFSVTTLFMTCEP